MKKKIVYFDKKKLAIVSIVLTVAIFFVIVFTLTVFRPYPLKFNDEITNAGIKYRVNPALIASVIYAESAYDTSSKSNKGAVGLMQIMPTTAIWLADLMGVEYNQNKLYESTYNINMGAYYLSYLFSKFDDATTVLAAYNAGEGNVSLWLVNSKYSNDGEKLETTPFKETNSYIDKVLNAYEFYDEYFMTIY